MKRDRIAAVAIREALAKIPGLGRRRDGSAAGFGSDLRADGECGEATGEVQARLEFGRMAFAIRQRLMEQDQGKTARRRAVASYTAFGGGAGVGACAGADGEYSFAREARRGGSIRRLGELGAGAYGVGSGVIGDKCGGSGRRDGRFMTGWRSWTCGR